MASSPKLMSILFLFALFSMQIHAREFFNKIPRVNNNEKEHESSIPDNQKTSLPNRKEKTVGKQEQEPRFIPETKNGYGLYGHESSQLPPSTTNTRETYEPYVTLVRYHPDEPYNSILESSNNNENTRYYNKNSYETEERNFGEARFTKKGWSNENTNNNNGEKKGMSDTRYLENGRYYHDVKAENNYYPNQYENSRGVASRNEYNENRYNNMGRYNQNQEKFQENEEDFEP